MLVMKASKMNEHVTAESALCQLTSRADFENYVVLQGRPQVKALAPRGCATDLSNLAS